MGSTVHCCPGPTVCADCGRRAAGPLPDEPGGYVGSRGVFRREVRDPVLSPSGPLTDLDGNVITDPQRPRGFPGFDGMSASVTLSLGGVDAGTRVPVTYAYISDAHDLHPPTPSRTRYDHIAQGPGEDGYVEQLQAYDQAFGTFFDRLATGRITRDNTLFVFSGGGGGSVRRWRAGEPGCDGVTTPCVWEHVSCQSDCPSNDGGRDQREPSRAACDGAGRTHRVRRALGHGAGLLPGRESGAGCRGGPYVRA